ncbi:jerky, putative [Talaromyces stipitatus ATCC 10500]|uniref:Jerky, putative n=1 Tax=Talaromyces stipitatus (strain ATCC 10500 / CBS 375.48 / QM 6759 / NRRL 1006) TaxID=441959 RepID=B8MC88_TALSN|nr:jerky, putative [Talaromyces stipitatus ATCC 10500]EED18534.1 jerky, putative [Talaromyces stipitatus ATCC 10500]
MQQQRAQRHRKAIPNEWKAALRAQKRINQHLTHKDLTKWFEDTYNQPIDRASITRILSYKYAFIDDLEPHQLKDKRRRVEQWPELEKAVMDWIRLAETEAPISQEAIRYKAQQYWPPLHPNDPIPSFRNGWLFVFQTRNNIKNRKLHGEVASLSTDGADQMIKIRRLLASYPPHDIFNCDESGLFWELFPDRSLSTSALPGRNILFACNSDGSERIPLWIIGNTKKPRAFTQAHIEPHNLGIQWRSNGKAWMTSDIFKEWLLAFDAQMAGRNYTTIIYFPPDSTTKYQPLEQGIIQAWKALWKRAWVRFIIDEFDRGIDPLSTMTILRAVRWAVNMWEGVTSTTITNCFKKALHDETEAEFESALLIQDLQNSLQDLKLTNRVQDVMDIHQFLNPLDEQVNDTMMDIDNIV